jgi:DNA topoisomerase-1
MKYNLSKTLIIVESYSKCKKIETYLGNSYSVFASLGHVRELISIKDIDIENNFNPKYSLISDKKKAKHYENLRKEIKNADEVILATDDDREGESIAWHICMLFKLPIETTKRIVFHEITENAIKSSLINPRTLNMNIVFSQQSRQILDLLLGHSITPILWKHLPEYNNEKNKTLSAGRCQTPALKIIYDNYIDINNSLSLNKQVYNTIGYFTSNIIPFELNKNFEIKEDLVCFLKECINYNHSYSCTEPKKNFVFSPEPLITSRLLQVCNIELKLSPKETMKICQKLYEEGYITYMRTETKKYSKEFIDSIKQFIRKEYNEEFIKREIESLVINLSCVSPENPQKSEAHEAIRPTDIKTRSLCETLFSTKERKVYNLIWENSIESCIANAELVTITAKFTAPTDLFFSHQTEMYTFLGWKIIKKKTLKSNIKNYYNYFQTIKEKTILNPKKIISKISLINTKSHLTESSLIQILEDKYIGRPSTYAMLIEKIKERGYVKIEDIKGINIECEDYTLEDNIINKIVTLREFGNEKNKMVIQELGLTVIKFLTDNFNELFEYEYTKNLELELDKISNGDNLWYVLCGKYYKEIKELCDAMNDLVREPKQKTQSKQLKKQLKENEVLLGKYNEEDLILKKGIYGLYVVWGTNQKSLSCFGNRPIENIDYDDVLKVIDNEKTDIIRVIDDNICIKNGKYGHYICYKSLKMKKPKFINLSNFDYDYITCDANIVKNWVLLNS